MRFSRFFAVAIVLAAAISVSGCHSHRLVASTGETTVKVYSNEDTYKKIKALGDRGGMFGMVAKMAEKAATKELDDKTPVKIVSSDPDGAQIEVTDGPNKGATGFVPTANVE